MIVLIIRSAQYTGGKLTPHW